VYACPARAFFKTAAATYWYPIMIMIAVRVCVRASARACGRVRDRARAGAFVRVRAHGFERGREDALSTPALTPGKLISALN
jgi:hypothetical protein